MADQFSIAEISRLTGLASHTLRYYEQQFPVLLDVERSRGGHRIYRKRHLETLNSILKLLKDEKLSIRRAREVLGEPEEAVVAETASACEAEPQIEAENLAVSRMLLLVLERLDHICRNNENRDRMLHDLLKGQSINRNDELIDQIARCRHETHETVKLCQTVMQQRFKSN
ncbi:MAG: MerR family transcriptional regulator [Candidatus Riflebacteria bacterium]|nr:MerR family transcriptional regulator [Candidatus Riflebacteria bacterium]